jgi:hypothetical protein
LSLQPFGQIILKRPQLAPASRLYHLEPIGIETPFVESLTSFIIRLAGAHSVTTGNLCTGEIAREIGKPYLWSNRYPLHYELCEGINGVSEIANEWAGALEHLCSRDNLRLLTMLPWADVLSEHSMPRRKRAWCPDCYEDMFRSESGVYDPLLWFLRPVLVCIIHGRLLCSKCPNCDAESPVLSGRARPGCCSKCQSWLGRKSYSNPAPKEALSSSEMRLNERYTRSLGSLLQTGPTNPSPARDVIANSLSSLITNLADGNAAMFARYLDRNRSVICTWQRCNSRMRITDLLDICDRLGISLVDFLAGNTGLAIMRGKIIPRQRKTVVRKKRNWSELELQLQAILDNKEPVSLGDVSSRLDCNSRTLRYHFPQLCRAICNRWAKHCAELIQSRRAMVRETIRKVALKLVGAGIYPSRRVVWSMLEVKIHTKVVGMELTKLQAELSLTHLCGPSSRERGRHSRLTSPSTSIN